MTAALGFIPLRHEGKLTGLAAYGGPILADQIAARFFVNESGRISSDFRDYPEIVKFIQNLAKDVSREDASASIQQVLESTMLRSIGRLLELTKARHLGLSGGAFANVRLNRLLAEKLPIDEIFIYPAMGDEGMPAGGALFRPMCITYASHNASLIAKPFVCCIAPDVSIAAIPRSCSSIKLA
jgi:carbamoyltransferase